MKNYFESEDKIIIPFEKAIAILMRTYKTNTEESKKITRVFLGDDFYQDFPSEQYEDYKAWLESQNLNYSEKPNNSKIELTKEQIKILRDAFIDTLDVNNCIGCDKIKCEYCIVNKKSGNFAVDMYNATDAFINEINKTINEVIK